MKNTWLVLIISVICISNVNLQKICENIINTNIEESIIIQELGRNMHDLVKTETNR